MLIAYFRESRFVRTIRLRKIDDKMFRILYFKSFENFSESTEKKSVIESDEHGMFSNKTPPQAKKQGRFKSVAAVTG